MKNDSKESLPHRSPAGIRLVALTRLSPEALAEVSVLIGLCEAADSASPCLGFAAALNYDKELPPYHLAYEEGGEGRLLGAATLFAPMREEAELSACILPQARRQGIFGLLASAVRDSLRERGVARLLYVVDRASASGVSMLRAKGLPLHHSEYSMRFVGPRPASAGTPPLELRPASASDLEALSAMGASGFEDSPEESRRYIEANLDSPDREQFLALSEGKPVAMASLGRESGGAISINGLCVTPERRGQGLGRSMMEALLRLLLDRGEAAITLEVDSENEVAHRLYSSLGFQEREAVDYYLEPLSSVTKLR